MLSFHEKVSFSGEIVQIVSFHFLGFLFGRDQKMNLKRSPLNTLQTYLLTENQCEGVKKVAFENAYRFPLFPRI